MSPLEGMTRRDGGRVQKGRIARRKAWGTDPLPSSAADIAEVHTLLTPGRREEEGRAGQVTDDWNQPKYSKKQAAIAIGICISLLLVLNSITIFLAVPKAQEDLLSSPALNCPAPALCPIPWVGYGERCYYLSGVEANWTHSQSHCVSQGGSLVTLETLEEKDFVQHHIKHIGYWIGLKRKSLSQPWMRPDESLFNNLFPIRGEGLCAYVTGRGFSSTWCANIRYWICSKLAH